MSQKSILFPSDILLARDLAIQKNPHDINGYDAIRICVEKRKNYQGADFMPFQIFNPKVNDWTSICLKIIGLQHIGKIRTPDDPIRLKYPGINVAFKSRDTFTRKVMVDGEIHEVVEPYGEAKVWLSNAYKHKMKELHDQFLCCDKGTKLVTPVRFTKKVDGKMVPDPDPYINVTIPYVHKTNENDKRNPNTLFRYLILDAKKPIPRAINGWKFAQATVENDNGIQESINNGNIHKFILGGSKITGTEDFSVCVSNLGCSLLNNMQDILVNQATKMKVTQDMFDELDLEDIANANAEYIETDNQENDENDENDEIILETISDGTESVSMRLDDFF